MGWAPPSRARLPLAAVALVHLLVLGFWWAATHRALPAPTRAEPRPLLLRWLPLPRPAAPADAPAPRREKAPAVPRPAQPPEPAAITQPAAAPAAPAPAPEPATTAASAAAPPLDLRLPTGPTATWRQRPAPRDDPRANTPRLTLEQKLEQAMGGDGQWREERVDNDRVVFRRGGECLMATRSRAGQLELAGGAFRNLWSVRAC